MNKRLIQALISVSSTSAEAKQLAAEVMMEKSPELVRQLYAKIDDLERQVAELLAASPDKDPLTDEQKEGVAQQMNTLLKDVKTGKELLKYGRSYIEMFPINMRAAVAAALKNKSVELNAPPLDVWLDVIALDGELK